MRGAIAGFAGVVITMSKIMLSLLDRSWLKKLKGKWEIGKKKNWVKLRKAEHLWL